MKKIRLGKECAIGSDLYHLDDALNSIEFMTEDQQIEILKSEPMAIYFIKERTAAVCKVACEGNGEALFYTPHKLRTLELCIIACKQNGTAIRYVPEDIRTPVLCRAACAQNGTALFFIIKEKRTPELLYLARANNFELTEKENILADQFEETLEWII